ncbi:metal ABC transporter permease [Marinisporobacter balticus]|uniref:Zinc transport system permease protein n=1 Tax=Marinisporobacter balticus TaxID=2018667 RepID=A0A4R2KUX9_9FIRM|nr:metal ABC transporter permease [Marinisporobacter balticus]TCO74956.1 zinc transport system permease protein [Marinisporobacter balticus]
MLEAIFEYKFLQHAILSAMLASIACGIMGTIITEKKLIMMSGGIAHTAFGGIGMGYFLGIEPIIGALVFSILAALGIAKINKKINTSADILVGMFWSFGMAIGIVFIGLAPGYPPDISSYLFGNILTVSKLDLGIISFLDMIIVFVVFAYFHQFKAYLFDEEFTQVIGVAVHLLEYTLFILIALTIVILIRVVGIILIITLLTAPTSIAKQFTYDLKKMMMISIMMGIVFCFVGLLLSYVMEIPSGAAIIIFSVLSYLLISFIKYLSKNSNKELPF